jgi:hypothetical protein
VTGVLGGGGGRGRWSSGRPVSVCDGGWTTTVSVPTRCTNQDLISIKHCSRSKGRNDGRIASHSHRTRGGYKNLPLPPPHYQKNRRLYRGACFRKFPKLLGTKVQNVKTGVLGFLTPSGKGVNTRTNNLRVHTTGSYTRTTSVGTTALSHNIVFICEDINALGWDSQVLFWGNFRLWRPNRAFRVAGVA